MRRHPHGGNVSRREACVKCGPAPARVPDEMIEARRNAGQSKSMYRRTWCTIQSPNSVRIARTKLT